MSYERTVFYNGQTIDAAQTLNKFDSAIYDLMTNGPVAVTVCTVDNVTVNANANAKAEAQLVHPVGAGFIPIGIINIICASGSSQASGVTINATALQRFEIDAVNDVARCYWRNTSSTAFKIKTTFSVLWIRSGDDLPAAAALSLDE